MPTKRELQDQRSQVDKAVRLIEGKGTEGWGQVAATRRPVKTIVQAARARGVRHVIVVAPETARWRQFVEGNLAKDVARRLGSEVQVESMAP
jgi:K+-sensing histidine kinase KdpD